MATAAQRQIRTSPRKHKPIPRKTSWWERIALFFGAIFLLGLVGLLTGLVYLIYLFASVKDSLPSPDQLVEAKPGGVTRIYATDKDPRTNEPFILGRIYGKFKERASIKEIPDVVKNATIAIEDERFYRHPGVDFWAIGRAMYRNFQARRMSEGASTLTQQLARNIFLTNKKTIDRKLQEMMLAIQIEKNFTKDEVLEMYLNEVNYGKRTYGIKAAADVYFGKKDLKKLTIAEAALLAGIPQRPSAYEPFRHLDAAISRRNVVLAKMRELNLITPEQYEKARQEKPKLAEEPDPMSTDFKAPYFTHYVVQELKRQMRPALQAEFGDKWEEEYVERLYGGGLKIYTTINLQMQKEAERALINGINAVRDRGVRQGALVSVEPRTGYIRAMVGGYSYEKDEYNNAVYGKRQPGSTFKPIVYAAAFKTGKFGPYSSLSNSSVSFRSGGGYWTPRNYDGRYGGYLTITEALKRSTNIPAVRVANTIGGKVIMETAAAVGLQFPDNNWNLAKALGAQEFSPLQMASAYTAFVNNGNYARPMCLIKVIDPDGVELLNNEPEVTKSAIPAHVAQQIDSILMQVVQSGTGRPVQDPALPNARGKTGTTNDRRDIWFIGYTKELSTAVWLSGETKDKKGRKIYPSLKADTFGGRTCGPIWLRFMKAAVPIQQQWKPSQLPLNNAALAAKAGLLSSPIDGNKAKASEDDEEQNERRISRRRRRRNREAEAVESSRFTEPAAVPEVSAPSSDANAPGDGAVPIEERSESDPTPSNNEPPPPSEPAATEVKPIKIKIDGRES